MHCLVHQGTTRQDTTNDRQDTTNDRQDTTNDRQATTNVARQAFWDLGAVASYRNGRAAVQV